MAIKQTIPPQAHEILEQDPAVIYLDVRTVPEFTAGHPQRGINIPVVFFQAPGQPASNPDFLKVVETNIPKDTTVVADCQSGGRSLMAAGKIGPAAHPGRPQPLRGITGK